jgi:transcriptional regulator with XRE-family HTH domain
MARMDQEALATAAGISGNTLRRLESMEGQLRSTIATVQALQRELEGRGIEFTDGDAPGVRMRVSTAA